MVRYDYNNYYRATLPIVTTQLTLLHVTKLDRPDLIYKSMIPYWLKAGWPRYLASHYKSIKEPVMLLLTIVRTFKKRFSFLPFAVSSFKTMYFRPAKFKVDEFL